MNSLPATADCLSAAQVSRVAAQTPKSSTVTATTTISSTPSSFDTTDGDILAITKVSGAATSELAIGGNFSHVITPDGKSHAAKNFAVVSETSGAVLYAGNASSYVRAITSYAGTIYVGGDFTQFGGVARTHGAALSSTFAVTAWNPAPTKTIRALAADSTGVYTAGDNASVRKFSLAGTQLWQQTVSGGSVHSLLVAAGGLYVGGLFESYDGVVQHGLILANLSSGAIVPTFNAHLRADTNQGEYGAYDGEEIISLSPGSSSSTILIGSGGHAPAGLSSNEIKILNATTGSVVMAKSLIGDGQAVATVGSTVVAGYHRNNQNTSIPYPYFCAQLEASDGSLTSWDPKLTGTQSNADGGNNGVQAMYADSTAKTLFIAGAFTKYNNVSSHKSLIAFKWS